MKYKKPIILLFFISLNLLVYSCGVYTFSPSALGGANSIAIPVFENKTTEYGLEDLITEGLSQEFLTDNTLKVVPEGRADLIATGAVTSYAHEPYTYDASETVQEYICRISLAVKIQYVNSEKILWEDNNLSDFGVYSVVDGQTRDEGNQAAMDKLIEEILNRTVKGW
ncbi:MAG: LptE family protein [candidate division Zixibacteria bacterium]|nr:LptE family protein [candidate division Zixibacteria bacterium]